MRATGPSGPWLSALQGATLTFVSSLQSRLAIIVSVFVSVAMAAFASVLYIEFANGQFSLDERSLVAQTEELVELVSREGLDVVLPEPRDADAIDPPYTGLFKGGLPVLGLSVRSFDGKFVRATPNYTSATYLREPVIDSTVRLLRAFDRKTGTELIVAQVSLPRERMILQVARPASDHAAIMNTFFLQSIEELWWGPLLIIGVMTLTAVITTRISLRDIRRLSDEADRIGLENIGQIKLKTDNIPQEIAPLVASFNAVLDRVDAGVEAQRHFSIHAAHELRTPLSDLRIRVDDLKNDDERLAMLLDIRAITRVIDQLLVLARLEGAERLSEIVAVDLSDVVCNICRDHAASVIGGGRQLAFDNVSSGEGLARGDPRLIEIILRNLLENSIRHTPRGTTITVTVLSPQTLSVADDGPGIDDAFHDKIFERFWKGRPNARNGSGLGLSICRIAMALMGGTVQLDRANSPGARFVLQFKAASRS